MNKLNTQNASNGAGASRREQTFTKDAKPVAREVIHQITPDDVIKAKVPPSSKKAEPLRAAKGDDDVMSQQPTKH